MWSLAGSRRLSEFAIRIDVPPHAIFVEAKRTFANRSEADRPVDPKPCALLPGHGIA